MGNSILAIDYTYIKVYRKVFRWWFYHCSINRYSDDGLEVLHSIRDLYRKLWGFKKVKLILCWNEEEHIF